ARGVDPLAADHRDVGGFVSLGFETIVDGGGLDLNGAEIGGVDDPDGEGQGEACENVPQDRRQDLLSVCHEISPRERLLSLYLPEPVHVCPRSNGGRMFPESIATLLIAGSVP